MALPSEKDHTLVWKLEAEIFKELLGEMKGISCSSYLEFFQEIHRKKITDRVQDWIAAVMVKLSHDYASSSHVRNSLFYRLVRCIQERQVKLGSQSSSLQARNKSMHNLSRKMLELHDRLIANEGGFRLTSTLQEIAKKAMDSEVVNPQAFAEIMETLPEELLKPQFSDSNSEDQPRKLSGNGLESELHMHVTTPQQSVWQQLIKISSCLDQSEKYVLEFLPGSNTMKLLEGIWPRVNDGAAESQVAIVSRPSSLQNGPNIFHNFLQLPLEVRITIWKSALPDGRLVFSREFRLHIGINRKDYVARLNLQSVCKESNMVIRWNYSLVFEIRRDSKHTCLMYHHIRNHSNLDLDGDIQKEMLQLNRTYINPDEDTIVRALDCCAFNPEGTMLSLDWSSRLFGLARVKHLALDLNYFRSIIKSMRQGEPIEMNQIHLLEASCPSLETLIVTLRCGKFVAKFLGDENNHQGRNFKLIDINDSFMDHVMTHSIRGGDMRNMARDFQAYCECFSKLFKQLQESDSS